jgi:basic membrane protein A
MSGNSGRIHRLLALVLTLVVGLAYAGCGGSESEDGGAASAGAKETPAATSAPADAKEPLKVGYMTATPINAGSWDPTLYGAVTPIAEEHGWEVDLAETVPAAQAKQVLERFAANKADLVLVTSQDYEKTMLEVAAANPDTKFVMMTDLSTTNDLPNVAAFAVDWHQFGFLGGAAAALASKSGKIGLIGGQPITPCLKAFGTAPEGAKAINPSATTQVQYVNDWVDAAKAGQTAAALLNKGADATFSIAGGTVPGIMKSVEKAGGAAIGSYTDESKFAPDNVPTSVVLDWSAGALSKLADALENDSFEAGITKLTVENGGLSVLPFKGEGADEKTAKMEKLLEGIKSGEVTVSETTLKAA